ncbi:sentrin-specific protease 2-like [Dysidea avara]|uniref:sentrin-specific protease 2-like n=1 Tax=Dysidea avara TaxID=196820 RepID=UPI00332BE825
MGSSDMMDVDVFALFPGNWLTDKTIITFLKVAAIYSSKLNGKKAFVAFSFLYNNMCRDLDLAKKWYRNVNICDYSLWVVPVNINQSHWILVVLHPVKKELWLYDSVANTHPNCVVLLKNGWLQIRESHGKIFMHYHNTLICHCRLTAVTVEFCLYVGSWMRVNRH